MATLECLGDSKEFNAVRKVEEKKQEMTIKTVASRHLYSTGCQMQIILDSTPTYTMPRIWPEMWNVAR